MVLRLFVYLIGYALPFVIVSRLLYTKVFRQKLLERQARKQAQLSADHECPNCGEQVRVNELTVDTTRFVNGRWYHKSCLRQLLE